MDAIDHSTASRDARGDGESGWRGSTSRGVKIMCFISVLIFISVDNIEAPVFHIPCDQEYRQLQMESAADDANPWADMVNEALIPE